MGLFISFLVLCILPFGFSDFNVVDFGAIGDGIIDDSQALLKAWEATCEANNSAILQIPNNKTFLLNAVSFQGPCKSPNITILVLGNIVAPEKSAWKDDDTEKWIKFFDVDGLIVSGPGQLDGRGQGWWSSDDDAPTVLAFHHMKNLQLTRLHFLNSPKNHITLNGISGAILSNLTLIAPEDSPNTDGIDISDSTQVIVQDSLISTGDDCIAINNGSSFVNITHVACGPGHGISVGSLGEDGAYHTVEEVHVSNCNFTSTDNGVRIKTWQGGSGYARKISFEQIMLKAVKNPIIIDQYYCNGDHDCKNKTDNVQVSDIIYRGVHGSSENPMAINLLCSLTVPCINISIIDVNIKSLHPNKQSYATCTNAHGMSTDTSPPVPCLSNRVV